MAWVPISVRSETRKQLKLLCLDREDKIEYDTLINRFIEMWKRYSKVIEVKINDSSEPTDVNIPVRPETRGTLRMICADLEIEYDDLMNIFMTMWNKYKGVMNEENKTNN